jgi:hypothetical protein
MARATASDRADLLVVGLLSPEAWTDLLRR